VTYSLLTLGVTRLMFTYPNQNICKAISRPYGVLRPQIFTGASEWPSLTTHHSPKTRAPLQLFSKGIKCWLKISGAKNMQNLVRLWTILKFGGKYFRNG